MSIRERMESNRVLGVGVGAGFVLLAAIAMAVQFWPQKKPNLALQYYSDDDGQSWFSADISNVAPFDHNGKIAVIAQIFTYDDGSKKYCAYLAKFAPDAKKRLEAAIADAKAKGQPANEVSLLHDPFFMRSNTLVKLPGEKNPWIAYTDPATVQVFSLHSPDGSAVDQAFVY
jgi:hypothetical protein